MTHEEIIINLLKDKDSQNHLKIRERNSLEFKESFGLNSWAKYAKTMASFANNKGGYILFGIRDNPREVKGVNEGFFNFKQEKFTENLNACFSPEILWECGTVSVGELTVGYIYTEESENKPVIALKGESSEKISSGDIYYRYKARSEKIKYPEMVRIMDERAKKEREQLLRLMEIIRKNGTTNLGIVNYSSGKLSTPNGVDIAIDKELVVKALRKAKFIKEGSFIENGGTPVLRVTGDISLAEEIPVPDLEPDVQYPYIQKQLAEKLKITTGELYALIWKYNMKGQKKYHAAISVTATGKGKSHKFSDIALQFLAQKINDNKGNSKWLENIKGEYKNRDK